MSNTKKHTEKIWLTSKIRMGSEDRFKFYDKWLNWAVVYYAIMLVGFNVFGGQIPTISHIYSELALFLSVIVLALSILIQGSRLGEKASKYRSCYLALETLLSDANHMDNSDIQKKYQQILYAYPNHSEEDREYFIFKKIIMDGDKIQNANGEIKCGKLLMARVVGRLLLNISWVFLLYAFPMFFLWYSFMD